MQTELTDFYPILIAFAASGFFVGLVLAISRAFISRIPYFAEEETLQNIDYRQIAHSMGFSGLLMALLFALVAYPLYSSDSFTDGFGIKLALLMAIAFPIAELCEALICKFF